MEIESLKKIAEALGYEVELVDSAGVWIFNENKVSYLFYPQNNPAQLLEILTLLIDKDLSLEKGFCSKYKYFIVDELQANYKGHTITEVILKTAERLANEGRL